MIAVDTNILVYSHRTEITWHDAAFNCIRSLAEARSKWAIPWLCVHEFVSVVTNRKIHTPPTPAKLAFAQIRLWATGMNLEFLHEGPEHLDVLEKLSVQGGVTGAKIHDARIAAICLQHGVSELWTADRDFSRFPELKTRNPLVL